MIVLADADLERAANAATYYSMQNGGQTCVSIERVYVEAPIYDQLRRRRDRAREGAAPGPAGRAGQRRGRRDHVRRRSSTSCASTSSRRAQAGARITTGGHVREGERPLLRADRAGRRRPLDDGDDRGDVRPDGPDHEGRRRRGGDPAGQRLAVRPRRLGVDQGPRPRRGDRAPARGGLRRASTTRNVNYFAYELPMGGWKDSGLGVRHGAAGIRKYTRQQAILVTRFAHEARRAHVPLQRADDEAARAADEAAVRARFARLTAAVLAVLQQPDPR